MTERIRLPQRFQWKRNHSDEWRNGVVYPADRNRWHIDAGQRFGSFADDPWETMEHIIGADVVAFRWIDNDYHWLPPGGDCCGHSFKNNDDLREHLRGHLRFYHMPGDEQTQ